MSVWAEGTTCFIITEITLSDRNTLWSTIVPQRKLIPDYKFWSGKAWSDIWAGKIAVDLNHGKTEPPKSVHTMVCSADSWISILKKESEYMLDQHSYAVPVYDNNMMVIITIMVIRYQPFRMLEILKTIQKSCSGALIMVLSMNIMENYTSVLSLMIRFSSDSTKQVAAGICIKNLEI